MPLYLGAIVTINHEFGRDAKGPYYKINMEKDIKELVDGHDRSFGRDIKVKKTHVSPGMTLSKIEIKEQKYIDQYRSFVGKIMWYTTKVEPDMANVAIDLAVDMSHDGT